jgi:hypothetical protein
MKYLNDKTKVKYVFFISKFLTLFFLENIKFNICTIITALKRTYQQSVQDISALQTGFYLMTMRINGKVVATQKWQKF